MNWFDMVSLVIPALVSIIVRPGWSNGAKWLTALGVSCVAAFLQVVLMESCQVTCLSDLGAALTKTFLLVMGSYAAFWRPTGIATKIESNVNG